VEAVTRNKNSHQKALLDRLTDALLEDILFTPDADLLNEAQADGDHGATVARRAFERASRATGLRRLAASRRATRSRRQAGANIRALDPKTARGWLEEYIASHPDAASKLSGVPAARDRLSDEDVYGVLETLQRRGVLKQRSIDQGPDRR
jgi:hypothetical protein